MFTTKKFFCSLKKLMFWLTKKNIMAQLGITSVNQPTRKKGLNYENQNYKKKLRKTTLLQKEPHYFIGSMEPKNKVIKL